MADRIEYIWLDGQTTPQLRSKTKVVLGDPKKVIEGPKEWGFDGSSTYQADGHNSDLVLRPVRYVRSPLPTVDALVLCEVLDENGDPHTSNTRARLRTAAEQTLGREPLFGVEQEYTMLEWIDSQSVWPLGFTFGIPEGQGPFYCGVGHGVAMGRKLADAHLEACLRAGLCMYGINSEVMPGQWEFQVGTADPLTVADHLWLARWLLQRVGEDHNIAISWDPKPADGDWNGAGAHTNFSTLAMREEGGMAHIEKAIARLQANHAKHIDHYGVGIARRLTGLHETCKLTEFRSGVADRGASVRVPLHVAREGRGYVEDRRPCANCDPNVVLALILETVLINPPDALP